jgi:hypothetical protein
MKKSLSWILCLSVFLQPASVFAQAVTKLQAETDFLKDRCAEFDTYSGERSDEWAKAQTALAHFKPDCYGRSCVRLAVLKKKTLTNLSTCHNASVQLALNPKSACYYRGLTQAGSTDPVFKTPLDFCSALISVEGVGVVSTFLDSFPDLKDCIHLTAQNRDSESLTRLMLDNAKCTLEMTPDHFACASFRPVGVHYVEALLEYKKLNETKQILTAPVTDECSLQNGVDSQMLWNKRDQISLKCLEQASKSCKVVLKTAQDKEAKAREDAQYNSQSYPLDLSPKMNQAPKPVPHLGGAPASQPPAPVNVEKAKN